MHFGNYVRFEHTQRNIELHKITKRSNGIFEYLAIIKSEIMRLVTLSRVNSETLTLITVNSETLTLINCILYNLLRAHAISAVRARFSAEQEHVR